MKTIQFREAICEAMSEEMRRDETIYLMGEEVAEYNGAYKASKGMLDEFGALTCNRHTYFRTWFCRNCYWFCHEWQQAHCRVYDF